MLPRIVRRKDGAHQCDGCDARLTVAIEVGHEMTYESATAQLCPRCVRLAAKLADEAETTARDEELADLIAKVRHLPAPTEAERNEFRASFAYGNLALMREYENASPEKLAELRALCRKAAGCKP